MNGSDAGCENNQRSFSSFFCHVGYYLYYTQETIQQLPSSSVASIAPIPITSSTTLVVVLVVVSHAVVQGLFVAADKTGQRTHSAGISDVLQRQLLQFTGFSFVQHNRVCGLIPTRRQFFRNHHFRNDGMNQSGRHFKFIDQFVQRHTVVMCTVGK